MSKNADRDSAGSNEREQEDPEKLFVRLTELAEKAAARCRVPDYREDLAQSAFEELWRHRQRTAERVSDSTVSAMVMRFAREERRRRRESGPTTNDADTLPSSHAKRRKEMLDSDAVSLGTPLRPAASFVPPLCPILHRLISDSDKAEHLEESILAACVQLSRDRGLLSDLRHHIFDSAYVRLCSGDAIAKRFGFRRRVVRERLRRISSTLESALLRQLESEIDVAAWIRLSSAIETVTFEKKNKIVVTPLSERTYELLAIAIRRVIHRKP